MICRPSRPSPQPLEDDLADRSAGVAEQGRTRRSSAAPTSSASSPTRHVAAPVGRRAGRGARRMAGLRPPLPLRSLHGPAQPPDTDRRGGGAAGADGVIVRSAAAPRGHELHHDRGRHQGRCRECTRPGLATGRARHRVDRWSDGLRRGRRGRSGLVARQPGLGQRPGEKRGALTGPNPTDRAKRGTKYHLLVDRSGLPLNIAVSAANRHDSMVLEPILDSMPTIRGVGRGHPRRRPVKLHARLGL
jgi:Transposase DDE domain